MIAAEPLHADSSATAAVVFVGYGVEAPELGIDDYRGLNVEGKIVLTLAGVPDHLPNEERAHLANNRTKARTAARHGAVGLLRASRPVDGQPDPFERAVASSTSIGISWVDPLGEPYDATPELRVGADVSPTTAAAMFAGAERSFADIGVQANTAKPDGVPTGFELPVKVTLTQHSIHGEFESLNVVGFLEGSDPDLRDEAVVVTAHLDHVGVGRPVNGDAIYNGAGDNASGAAVLMEIGYGLAAANTRPRRSILFVAVTAEERGLVGSDYFIHNSPVSIGNIVANVNLDSGVFLYDFADIIPFGSLHSSLEASVQRIADRMGLAIGTDPMPEQGLFVRSDHYRFVQQGIPSIFFMLGLTALDDGIDGLTELRRYVTDHLHRPSDDMSLPWDFEAGAKYARFVMQFIRDVADADDRPTWNDGDVFARGEPH